MSREWAMPNKWTFQVPPIEAFVRRWLCGRDVIIDPFAGTSTFGTIRNDMADSGFDSVAWLRTLDIQADAVLLDPPYSPRQMSEAYKLAGLPIGMAGTQNARLYKACKDLLSPLLRPGGIALSFGWNSQGFGLDRGFALREILLVAHGGAHNDTICVAEEKIATQARLEAS